MKLKNLLPLLIFPLLFFYGCSSTGGNVDGSRSDSDSNPYLITTNGSLSSLSQNEIDAEYNTFFFVKDEVRNIYLGGKLSSSLNDDDRIRIQTSYWQQKMHILSSNVNDSNYYGVPFSIYVTNTSLDTFDYSATCDIGLQNGYTFTPYNSTNLTLKVAANNDARNWGLRVYQQQSYNVLNTTKDDIVKAFNDMHVYFNYFGQDYITDVNHSLADEILPLDFNQAQVDKDSLVVYAMNKIYPSSTVDDALNTYFNFHPNEGLLFYVKDYRPKNFPPDYQPLGYTFEHAYANGFKKQAPVSFVFVKRIKDLFSDNAENQVIKYTTIHELGHLWCDGFTDQNHTLWHNGDNKTACAIIAPIHYPTPTQEDNKILNHLGFCEGHLQRGMNVSWKLKQYSPFGDITATQSNQILFASNKNFNYTQNQDLEIEISCNKPEVIQGEHIDILVKEINRSNKKITFGALKHYLYDYNNNTTITNHYGEGHVYVEIPANGSNYLLVNPQGYLLFKGMDSSTNTFPPGSYDYYVSLFIGGKEIKSNKINFRIKPVPDSLKQAYEDLQFDPKKYNPNKNYMLEAEKKFEKYKDTYYEKEFYYKLLRYPKYYEGEKEKKENAFKDFVLKYSDSDAAYYIFQGVLGFNNDKLTKDIIEHLRTKNPNCNLLKVLKHQPEYLNSPLKTLLNEGDKR